MTIETCISAAQSNGLTYAGLEYAKECWAANVIDTGGGPASDGEAKCNMACGGASFENCGGPARFNLWSFSPSTATSVSVTSGATGKVIATSTLDLL